MTNVLTIGSISHYSEAIYTLLFLYYESKQPFIINKNFGT
jgi:hypothetical protein